MTGPSGALLTVSFDRATVGAVRRQIGRCASSVGLSSERLGEFEIAVSEVLANAVIHGGGGGKVVLHRENGYLRCVVNDHGPGMPRDYVIPRRLDPEAESGRGLWLVRAVCSSVALRSSSGGNRVELTMDLR